MSDPLRVYLHDHLAGANFALELLQSMGDQTADAELAGFAKGLLAEIEADVEVLKEIIEHVGTSSFDLKSAAAWLAEKASRLKLQHGNPGDLGTFETLEALSLGILGKRALWKVLRVLSQTGSRIPDRGFGELSARAKDQFSRVEEHRLRVALTTFKPEKET